MEYIPDEVVQILKSVSAQEVLQKFRRCRGNFQNGDLWSDGHLARSAGYKVTATVIRRSTEHQAQVHASPQLFRCGNPVAPGKLRGASLEYYPMTTGLM